MIVRGALVFMMILFFSLGFLSRPIMAQGMEIDDSFTFEIGLPNSFVNKPFKDFMQGLVSVSPSYQYTLERGFAFVLERIILISQ